MPLDVAGAVGREEGALARAGAAVAGPAQALGEEGEAEAGEAERDGAWERLGVWVCGRFSVERVS